MTILRIAGNNGEYVSIQVKTYEHADANNSDDANWLVVRTVVDCGDFRGHVETSFRTYDFVIFLSCFEKLSRSEVRKVSFSTMEDSLEFSIEMDNMGRTQVVGYLRDVRRENVELSFAFDADQSYFPSISMALSEIVTTFPVRNVPSA